MADWRDRYHRIHGPGPRPGVTREMVDGLIFVFDGDKIAPKLDLPPDHVPERPQDAEGLTHLMVYGDGGASSMMGGLVVVSSARMTTACGTTAVDAAGLFWQTKANPVTCPVCRPIADARDGRID